MVSRVLDGKLDECDPAWQALDAATGTAAVSEAP
jgi:hypothetical protein